MPEMEEKEQKGDEAPSATSRADLHTHTIYSDGALTPHELIKKASEAGISVLSITDHDNVGAIDEAIEWGKQYNVEIVTGLELSVTLGDKDIHLLAYFFDHTNRNLLDYLTFFRQERLRRAERIVQKLNKINIPLSMDSVLDQAGVGSVGRPHIANALMEEGLTDSYHEAFSKYIGAGAPAYEKKYQVSPEEAVKLISSARGLSFFAHPGKYTSETDLLHIIRSGIDGIEVIHPSHDENRQQHYRSVVNQYFLLESGGSDFHGGKKNDDYAFGSFTVPMTVVDSMQSRLVS